MTTCSTCCFFVQESYVTDLDDNKVFYGRCYRYPPKWYNHPRTCVRPEVAALSKCCGEHSAMNDDKK